MTSKHLIVENIDREVTPDQIRNLFSVHGDVRTVVLRRGSGTGFIDMMSTSEAERARKNLDGETLWGRSLAVTTPGETLGGRLSYLLKRFL